MLRTVACSLVVLCIASSPARAAPGDPVATVGQARITEGEVAHWLRIAAISNARDAHRRVPRRGTAAWRELRDQVMQLLIQNLWVAGEAALRGVVVTDADVQAAFDQQRAQAFPRQADFARFLRSSGFTAADVRLRVRLELTSNRLREAVLGDVPSPTPRAIRASYERNIDRYRRPERRDLRIVLTRTEAQARRARAALTGGGSWRVVARRMSIDDATRRRGGVLAGVRRGQVDPALEAAAFAARRGRLVGPVRTTFGFYVLRVDRVVPRRDRSLAEARPAIRDTLLARAQEAALDAYITDFRRRWRSVTSCVRPYVTSDCANGPPAPPGPLEDDRR